MSTAPWSQGSERLTEAVAQHVRDGDVVGIGGQNIARCAIALATEILRQGQGDLSLVGCNLSLHADLLVGADRVRRLECGTGNLERFGVTHRIARAIEEGRIEIEDYDHLGMLSRFLAAGMGLPFLPIRHLDDTDLLWDSGSTESAKFALVDNPWDPGDKVRLVPALQPDVALIHAQAADRQGNIVIHGPASHDPELIRASTKVLVTVEAVHGDLNFDAQTPGTVIPAIYLTEVIHAPRGAWPTAVFGDYDHDSETIAAYQALAKVGGADYDRYLDQLAAMRRASS